MGVGPDAQEEARVDNALHLWKLHGEDIPVVDEYIYLGIPFTATTVSMDAMIAHRLASATRTWGMIRGVVTRWCYPVRHRISIVKSILLPILIYGSELWGMCEGRVKRLQHLLNEILKCLFGIKYTHSLASLAVIHQEMGFYCIHAITCAAKSRGFTKYPSLQTYISDLCKNEPVGSGAWTYVMSCIRYLSRTNRILLNEIKQGLVEPSEAYARVLEREHLSFIADGTQSTQRYESGSYVDTMAFVRLSSKFPSEAMKIRWLWRARSNSLWLVPQLVRAKKDIPQGDQHRCPLCRTPLTNGESLHHLMLNCRIMDAERLACISSMITAARALILHRYEVETRLSDINADIVILLLGGKVFRDGVAHELPAWLAVPLQIPPPIPGPIMPAVNPTPPQVPGYLQVARFLDALMRVRLPCVRALLPQESTPQGMTAALPAHVGEEDD